MYPRPNKYTNRVDFKDSSNFKLKTHRVHAIITIGIRECKLPT
jgi:hypothetical protein